MTAGPPQAERDPTSGDGPVYAPTPRWVKVFGVVALALAAAFVILHLTGRGFRGHHSPPTVEVPERP